MRLPNSQLNGVNSNNLVNRIVMNFFKISASSCEGSRKCQLKKESNLPVRLLVQIEIFFKKLDQILKGQLAKM